MAALEKAVKTGNMTNWLKKQRNEDKSSDI